MAHEFVIDNRTFAKDLGDTRIDTLTYAFLPENQIPQSFKSAFERAFAWWSEVIQVDFIEDHNNFSAADIHIGFYRAYCGCGTTNSPVTCPNLAHTSVRYGRICINADTPWVVDVEEDEEESTDALDLESAATHEIGHVLGLWHSENRNSVMYKGISPGERRANLHRDDVEQIQKLYPARLADPIQLDGKSSLTSYELYIWIIFCIAMVFIFFCAPSDFVRFRNIP